MDDTDNITEEIIVPGNSNSSSDAEKYNKTEGKFQYSAWIFCIFYLFRNCSWYHELSENNPENPNLQSLEYTDLFDCLTTLQKI